MPFGRCAVHLRGVLVPVPVPVPGAHGRLLVRSGGPTVSLAGLGMASCGSQMGG